MSLRMDAELRDMRERLGIGVQDLTSDELEMFVLAVRRCENPYSDANLELMDRPFEICRGVYGWRMTAGAHVWLEEYALKWWKRGSVMYRMAQAYAMMNAKNLDAFAPLTEKTAARKAVMRNALKLVCHRSEFSYALLRAYGQEKDLTHKPDDARSRQAKRAKHDFAAMVARLEVASGMPAKVWLWDRSFMSMMKSYAELHAFAAAFATGKESRAKMDDELNDAVNDLARIKLQIYRRVKNEQGT